MPSSNQPFRTPRRPAAAALAFALLAAVSLISGPAAAEPPGRDWVGRFMGELSRGAWPIGDGLEFVDVDVTREIQEGRAVVVVKGRIVNVVDRVVAVPPIESLLVDGDDRELAKVAIEAPEAELEPGRSLDFVAVHEDLPASTRNIEVGFAESGAGTPSPQPPGNATVLEGLEFSEEVVDGVPVKRASGAIVNKSDAPVPVAAIIVSLYADSGALAQRAVFDPPEREVPAGGSMPFTIRVENPVPGAHRISVKVTGTAGVYQSMRTAEKVLVAGIEIHRNLVRGVDVLEVTGRLVNTTSGPVSVPPLVVVLVDGRDEEVRRLRFDPPRQGLAAGERAPFEVRIEEPDPRARRLEVLLDDGMSAR